MLQNWLKPVQLQVPEPQNGTLGEHIDTWRSDFPNLKKAKIALLGADEKAADRIRAALYPLSNTFKKTAIADIGNLRKPDPELLIPVIYELLSGKIVPVIIGADERLIKAQFLAYQNAKALVNLAVIDEKLRQNESDYSALLQPRHPLLFQFGLVGCQSHFMLPDQQRFLEKNHFDVVRLGKSRAAIEETEPVLRDADLLAFHLSALKQSDAAAVETPSPAGFSWEEACQLSRYAGMSDKLSSFGIYGYQPKRDREAISAQGIAQMIWYFIEGVQQRVHDYPASSSGLTEYIVDFRGVQYQLTFWRSTKSGRWWMQVPDAKNKKHERHRLVPCSLQDYQAACRDELPERLLQALQRFS